MPLSDDQRAMLRLLAQREQGYGDIAALMGLSVEEVRDKVKDALAQLEEEGRSSPLPAEPTPAPDPPQPETPEEPVAVAPVATPPVPAAEEKAAPIAAGTAPRATGRSAASRPRISLPRSGGARAAIAAGAAVLVVLIVVLAVSGGGSSGSGGSGTTLAAETTVSGKEAASGTPVNSKEVTQATLDPVDGSDASGVAVFGRVKNSLALQIEANGLAPSGRGHSYTIWLYESPQKMLPLATTAVGKSGKIGAQVEVPTEVLAYLANEAFDQINVSLTEDQALKASLDKATQEKKAPAYTGADVLRGRITGPIIGAAKKK